MNINYFEALKEITIEEGAFELSIKGANYEQLLWLIECEISLEEIYINDELDEWALNNGYIKKGISNGK